MGCGLFQEKLTFIRDVPGLKKEHRNRAEAFLNDCVYHVTGLGIAGSPGGQDDGSVHDGHSHVNVSAYTMQTGVDTCAYQMNEG